MRELKSKRILIFSILVILMIFVIFAVLMLIQNLLIESNEKTKVEKFIPIETEIVELINKSDPRTKTEFIDLVREFIYGNSVKEFDSKHQEYARNMTYVLHKLYLSDLSGGKSKPHLSCGPRALAMKLILEKAGIQSRLVHLFSDNFSFFGDHTLLEVFNPDTQKWEIQDPDSNAYFIDTRTKERASIAEMIFDDIANFSLASGRVEETEKDWQERVMTHYFEGAVYDFEISQSSKSVFIYNPERLSLDKKFLDEEEFAFLEILLETTKPNLEGSLSFLDKTAMAKLSL